MLETYRIFLERVAAGRSLSLEEVDKIGQGRVWTGRQAHRIGLVDEVADDPADADAVSEAAAARGLVIAELLPMPANNLMLVLRREG